MSPNSLTAMTVSIAARMDSLSTSKSPAARYRRLGITSKPGASALCRASEFPGIPER